MPSRLSAFLTELKRRRVFRVAVVYAGVAFIIFQVADFAFPALHVPDWFSSAVVVLLALGFLVAVGLAWAFDLTAEGLVRTRESKRDQPKKPPRPVIGNKTLAVIAALAIIAAAWSWLREPSPGGAAISSIAVLPLDDHIGDPEQEYFTEAMHEAIISNLNRLSALKVISRTSAMRYKDTDKLMPEIARELNVDALVEGSVYKVGNHVRITAQLIHGASDEHLWDNEYEGDLTDILSLQKTVARAIAKEIGLALKPEEEAYLASAPQVNPEAYNLYLKGWHFRKLESSESMPKAVEYLEQAVALDPTFAQAYAALASSYRMGMYYPLVRDYRNRMKGALDKALELDPNQALAHAVLGVYQFLIDENSSAEASFRRALELEPNNVYIVYEYGLILSWTGRPDEALKQFRRAQELDPLNPLPLEGFGNLHHLIRQYDKAREYYQAALEIFPNQGMVQRRLNRTESRILMEQGRYAEVAEQMGVNTLDGIRARMAMGNEEEVYAFRDSLRSTGELQRWEQEDPYEAAYFYASIGEKEKALDLLERATEIDPPPLIYYPTFDFLRAEPRFKALLQKFGLTEVFDQYGERIR